MNNNILLVDDEETIRYVLRESLIDEGYSVDVACNGHQALERLSLKSYDLLITDIKMHGMNGLQLIREINKKGTNSKIVVITAYGSLETVKEATRLGVLEFLSKPFKIQEIKDVITRIFSGTEGPEEQESKGDLKSLDKIKEQLTDDFLVPKGLSYYFTGPASLPKNTIVFDFNAINRNKATLIFCNINEQSKKHREWWENKQIGIMIKTLFRSKLGCKPQTIVDYINKFLYGNIHPSVDMSILCALIDKRKRTIRYVNYGNSLVCSIFTKDGSMQTLETFPFLLGGVPEIKTVENSISYSEDSRLVLSSSNTIAKIMEKGAFIKQTIDNILRSVKDPHHKDQAGVVDLDGPFARNDETNFDDETVLLANLDWGPV